MNSQNTQTQLSLLSADMKLLSIFSQHGIMEPFRSKYLMEDLAQSHIADLLIKLFGKGTYSPAKCLIIGAGRGGLSSSLGCGGFIVDSLEPHLPYYEILLWKYKKRGLAGEVFNSQIEEICLNNNYYDCAAMIEVIEHVESPITALKSAFSSLKVGGKIYITAPARFQLIDPHYKIPFICWMPLRMADFLLYLLGLLKEDGVAGRQRLSSMHYFTFSALQKMSQEIGFSVVDVRSAQIFRPEEYTFCDDRFIKLALFAKKKKLSWLLRFLSRHFLGHRLLLVKR